MTVLPEKYWNRRMSEETIKHGKTSARAEFEREDLSARDVFNFLIGLAVVCVLVYFILRGMYAYLDAYQKAHQPPQSPLVKTTEIDTRMVGPEEITKFPQPRLEKNERLEINDLRLQEEKTLNSYGWVDEKAGVVHIPIERAMQLVVQRGLPTRAQNEQNPALPVSKGKHLDGKKN
jgi:hypothetical protein